MTAAVPYYNSFITSNKNDAYQSTDNKQSDIAFYNSGTVPVTINNSFRLFPSQSHVFECNQDEFDQSRYSWAFDNIAPGPGVDTSITLIIKRYV